MSLVMLGLGKEGEGLPSDVLGYADDFSLYM